MPLSHVAGAIASIASPPASRRIMAGGVGGASGTEAEQRKRMMIMRGAEETAIPLPRLDLGSGGPGDEEAGGTGTSVAAIGGG